MSLKTLPDDVAHLAQAEYNAVRTKANSFANRNWWWMVLAAFGIGELLGYIGGRIRWPF